MKEAVYVGDTQGDANACDMAGVPMIYASYGFGNVEGDYPVIRKFSDLLDLFQCKAIEEEMMIKEKEPSF